MVKLRSDPEAPKASEVPKDNEISEEDLKLINHLTWLYGGYKMRNRSKSPVYNETKIFKNSQKDIEKLSKSQNLSKKGSGRSLKESRNTNFKNKNPKSSESDETNNITASKRKIGRPSTRNRFIEDENSTGSSKWRESSQNNESECSLSNSDIESFTKTRDHNNHSILKYQLLNPEEINQKLEDVRYVLNRRLRFDYNLNLKDRRRPTWPRNFTLKDKIEYFISKQISDSTHFRTREPTTLSICDQFALQNHEAMVADSDRVHYYRAAIFWTGHTNKDDTNVSNTIPESNLTNEDDTNKLVCNHDRDNFNSKKYKNLRSLEEFDHLLKGEMGEGSETNPDLHLNNASTNFNNFSNQTSYETTLNNLSSNQPPRTDSCNDSTYLNTTAMNSNTNSNLDNCSVMSNREYEENNTNSYCYNKKILEIGTGPMCVLAMNALKAGAKSVDALEFSVHASRLAGKLMAAYGFDNIIKVFNTHSKLFTFDQNSYFSNFSSKNTPKSAKDTLNFSYCHNNNVNNNNDNGDNNSNNKDNDNSNNPDNNNDNNNNNNNNDNKNNNYTNNKDNDDNCDRGSGAVDRKDEGFELLLPPHPPYDMVISEILGDFASQEGVADVFLDFQRRILFENKRFVDMVKSIPCKASTMFVPSFFPDASNILNKSSSDSEMTIFSPSKKMLQSVGMRIDNLPICNEWLPLEILELEKWMLPQMCQHYLSLFKVSSFGDVAGLLVGIDVEIRPGEHFGTRYGQCESWYTNLVLFDQEYTVFENDLIIVSSVANLTNYVKVNCDTTKINVSRPSYSFQVYILSPIKMILSSSDTPTRLNLDHVSSKCTGNTDLDFPDDLKTFKNQSDDIYSKHSNHGQVKEDLKEHLPYSDKSNKNKKKNNNGNNNNNNNSNNNNSNNSNSNNNKKVKENNNGKTKKNSTKKNNNDNKLNHKQTSDFDEDHAHDSDQKEVHHFTKEEILNFNEEISNRLKHTKHQNLLFLGKNHKDKKDDLSAPNNANSTTFENSDSSKIPFHDNNNSHDNDVTLNNNGNNNNNNSVNNNNSNNSNSNNNNNDNSNNNNNNNLKKEEDQLVLLNSDSNTLYSNQKSDHFPPSTLRDNLLFSNIDENDKFNLDSYFVHASGKDLVLRTSVRLPCKELSEMTYDIDDIVKINLKQLNREYDCLGTTCSFAPDLLGDFQYAQLLGEVYKVIGKPPIIHIDYSEQTSTIYYDTPSAKRKMHTDPPKRYSKIKLKTSKNSSSTNI